MKAPEASNLKIILLGPPASGKGTQAEKIAERFHLPAKSTGAMLREEMRKRSPIGLDAEKLTSAGNLVPDEMIFEIIRNWANENPGGFLFDGFPRTLGQAELLENYLAESGSCLDHVLLLEVDEKEIHERVLHRVVCSQCGRSFRRENVEVAGNCPTCGGRLEHRSDDTEEVLTQRLTEYHAKTKPLADYYSQRGLLRRINGNLDPKGVFQQIETCLTETSQIPNDSLVAEATVLAQPFPEMREVVLANGHKLLARIPKEFQNNEKCFLPGEKIMVQLTTYDLSRGQILSSEVDRTEG